MTTKYLRDRQEIPVPALKTIVADIKKRWRDQQANDGQEVSDGQRRRERSGGTQRGGGSWRKMEDSEEEMDKLVN